MTGEEFEKQMKVILAKLSDATNLDFTWYVISSDPDVVSDFGVDHENNIVIMCDTFPLKVSNLTSIRYRFFPGNGFEDCYIRFDFDNTYLNCYYSDCDMGHLFDVRFFFAEEKHSLSRSGAISLLSKLKTMV